jgi:FAD/FMN-containing dehydrogenase
VRIIETPYPLHASDGFPSPDGVERESWDQLRQRFLAASKQAAAAAADVGRLDCELVCPSRPGMRPRIMTIREQLESLGAHNAYQCGRIVLLGQVQGLWPPPCGGFSW